MSDEVLDVADETDRGLFDAAGAMLADPDAEEALVGFLLNHPEAVEVARQEVEAGCFNDVWCQRLFQTVSDTVDRLDDLTLDTVQEALGGDWSAKLPAGETVGQFFARLKARAPAALDVEAVAQHIFDCAERRAIGDADDVRWDEPFRSEFGLTMWADQNDPGEEYDYLIEDLIPEREGVVLAGESQTGKSFLTFHMAMCGARGLPFFARRILKPFGTIWCAYEASRGQKARMRAYRRHYGLELEPLPFGVLTKPLKLWPLENQADRLIKEMRAIERTQFGGVPLKMIVFDTYNAATPGASEIDSETVSKIRLQFDRFREELGVTTVLVGHTNTVGKVRGNEQLYNNIETVILVSRKTRLVDRQPVDVRDDEGRVIREMKVKKQREGLDGEKTPFVLSVVEDGTVNKFGRARTSCVVDDPTIAEPEMVNSEGQGEGNRSVGASVSKNTKMFMECLLEALDEFGVAPPAEVPVARSVMRVVNYDYVKRLFSKKMLRDDDEDTEEGRKKHGARVRAELKRSRERLYEVRVVNYSKPYIWWTGKPVRGLRATQPKERDLFEPDSPLMTPDDIPGF